MVNSFLAIVGFDSTECEEDYLAVKLGAGGARNRSARIYGRLAVTTELQPV